LNSRVVRKQSAISRGLLERCADGRERSLPGRLKRVEVWTERRLEGGQESVRGRGGIDGRCAQVVEEGDEFSGMIHAEEVNERPGLRIAGRVVTSAESLVADQGGKAGRRLERSPGWETVVVGAADSRPSAAANDLELHRETFVQPEREIGLGASQAGASD
jgi:hypothetical protein